MIVVGAGQSALESAALLRESGAQVRLVVRGAKVKYNDPPRAGRQLQPWTPLGRGWHMYPFARQAGAFRYLPSRHRLQLVQRILGPAGAYWLKDHVEGQVPVLLDTTITGLASTTGSPC